MFRSVKASRFLLLGVLIVLLTLAYKIPNASASDLPPLHIPSVEEELQYGYPENDAGEHYGVEYLELDGVPSPDLTLAENEDGVLGYVRNDEINGMQVTSPEEAAAYMKAIEAQDGGYYVNMYLQDGTTVVGQFWVSGVQ